MLTFESNRIIRRTVIHTQTQITQIVQYSRSLTVQTDSMLIISQVTHVSSLVRVANATLGTQVSLRTIHESARFYTTTGAGSTNAPQLVTEFAEMSYSERLAIATYIYEGITEYERLGSEDRTSAGF